MEPKPFVMSNSVRSVSSSSLSMSATWASARKVFFAAPSDTPTPVCESARNDSLSATLIEIAFVIMLAYFICVEISEMVNAQRTEARGILAYFASPTNWVDLLEYALMTASVGVWCSVYFSSMLDNLQPSDILPRTDVYQDFFATSYLLKMTPEGQNKYETFFNDISNVMSRLQTYQLLVSLALIGTVVQLVATTTSAGERPVGDGRLRLWREGAGGWGLGAGGWGGGEFPEMGPEKPQALGVPRGVSGSF